MAFLAALLMFCFVCVNYFLHRDLLYPGLLQSSLWFVVLLIFLVHQGMFVPVSDSVFSLLIAGVFLFSLGAFLGSYNHKPHFMRNYVLSGTLPGRRTVVALACVVLLGLLLYLDRARELASTGPFDNAFINVRFAVSGDPEEGGGFGAVSYFVPLAYVLAAIVVLQRYGLARPTASRIFVGVVVLVGIIFGALSSGRGVLLPLIVVVLAIPAVLRFTKPVRTGIVLVVVTLLVFVAGGLALGKGGTIGNSLAENWTTMRESLITYSVGGIPALGVFLDNRGAELEMGMNSFRTISAVLQSLGFHTTVVPLVQVFVDVPMPTNVYTVYQPYIRDFGTLGGATVLFVLGFIHALLYRQATVRAPRGAYVFLFGVSLYPLVMQVFQDSYFSLLSTWIQYGVYAVLFFVVLSDREYARRWWRRATIRAES